MPFSLVFSHLLCRLTYACCCHFHQFCPPVHVDTITVVNSTISLIHLFFCPVLFLCLNWTDYDTFLPVEGKSSYSKCKNTKLKLRYFFLPIFSFISLSPVHPFIPFIHLSNQFKTSISFISETNKNEHNFLYFFRKLNFIFMLRD